MKKSVKIVLVALVLLFNTGLIFGQEAWLELGDKYFDQFAYKKAIKLYQGAIERGIDNWEIYAKLGDCYYYTSNTKKALENYDKAIGLNENIKPEYRLRYALSLQSDGKIDEAKEQFNLYNENFKPETLLIGTSKDLAINLPINSKYSEFGSFIYKDTMYFSSSRENPAKKRRDNKRLYKWNNQPYLDIYEAVINRNSNSVTLKQTENSSMDSLNTIAHEASVAITNDGKTMYYAGGNSKKNRLVYNERGTSNLKLKRAKLVNNKWLPDPDVKDLDVINSNNYSVGNPALNPDNSKLFFVTCAPYSEAKGQTDIYYVDLVDGKIPDNSVIHNLEDINTSGRESFPFISSEGDLYFSSDGLYNKKLGLGLLDIYRVNDIDKLIERRELNPNSKEKVEVINLGIPFNSDKDDFAYFVEAPLNAKDCETYAHFSSNRDGGVGDDDIYKAKVKIPKTIHGTINDSITGDYLTDAIVELIDSKGKILDTLEVSSSGSFNFKLNCDQTFSLRGSKELYYDALIKDVKPNDSTKNFKLELKPYPCKITIYHEYKYSTIISDSINVHERDLKPVLEFLIANPEVKIKIESYTDSRGSHEYNLYELSKERAEASKAYLINEGVKESQIISVEGFGETNPVITDEEIEKLNTTEEKEQAHQKNRRSIFIIDYANGLKNCEEIDSGG